MARGDGAGVLEMDVRVVEGGAGMADLRQDGADRALREQGHREGERAVRDGALLPDAPRHAAGGLSTGHAGTVADGAVVVKAALSVLFGVKA